MEGISEDEAGSCEDKCAFLSSYQLLSDNFDVDSHNSDFDPLRNKTNVKGSLRNNLEHLHHIGTNPSVIDTTENGYEAPFFTTPVSNFFRNQSNLQTQTL